MDFNFSEEQQMLRDSVARFVMQDYDFDTRQRIIREERGFSAGNWRQFAELGWLTVPFSEADGGLGGTAVDVIALLEELGKGIVLEPVLATLILGGGLIAEAGNEAQKSALLGEVMAGNLQLAFAYAERQSRYNLADVTASAIRDGDDYRINGEKIVVLNGGIADKLIVSVRTAGDRLDRGGISLLLVDGDSEGLEKHTYQTVNGDQAAEISFDDVSVAAGNLLGPEGEAAAVIEKIIDRATLAICAEAVGAMEVTYKKTVEYSKIREQFGTPIGRFQALQHRMVEMFMEHEQAKSILLMAAMQCDGAGGNDPKAVSAAKSRVGKAARLIGQEAVQIHGGIGITEELDVGHFFKRLTTIQSLFGNTDFHSRRFSNL